MNPSFLPDHKPRGTLGQRLFAWMDSSGTSYDETTAARKRALFGRLHGSILEIGPGIGPNLKYYPSDVHWMGVEPNPFMVPHLVKSIRELGRPKENYRIEPGDPRGTRLPAGDASLDAVISTLVLCSVPHPEDSLREILRILKPGGKFVFIEHVAAQRGTRLRRFQDFIQPLWSFVSGNCHPNRETWVSITHAGFEQVELEHYRYPGGGPAGPHISGTAVK